MKAEKRLLYFSSCAVHPGGVMDPFLMMELPWLRKHFDRVDIIARNQWMTDPGTDFRDLSDCQTHILPFPTLFFFRAILQKDFWREAVHLRSLVSLLKLFAFTARGLHMEAMAKAALKDNTSASLTFYSCWMSYDGYAAARCRRSYPNSFCTLRGHAFDIDAERNPMNPYLMKQMMCENADRIHLISQAALCQFRQYSDQWSFSRDKLRVTALGSHGEAIEPKFSSPGLKRGFFRIISVAQVLPIKQIHHIAEALRDWDGPPLEWYHVGGGEGLSALTLLMEEIADHNDHLIIHPLGELSPVELDELYERADFDVFVNASQKEGVPVSIMEAMRFCVPAIAPRVGGISEIVRGNTGICFEPNTVETLRGTLKSFLLLPEGDVMNMRACSQERWKSDYQNSALLPRLFV